MFFLRTSLPLIFLFPRFLKLGGVFLLLLINGLIVYGQSVEEYNRLKAKGNIPQDFLLSSKEKFEKAIKTIENQEQKDTRQAKEDFYEESAHYVNQLLLSGKVLFNDPVSEYVSNVGKYLLRGQPDLRRKVRFYAVKSTVVNAFSTNNGIILINMGLLARLENEAQLAFILAHEISHFSQKHPLEIFLKTRTLEKNTRTLFRPASLEDVLLAQNNYTKEKEQEADLKALELFLNSAYDLEAISSAFDILKYADLPLTDIPFNFDIFESTSLKFPETYFLKFPPKNSTPIPSTKLINSTHPGPDERRAIIDEKLNNQKDEKIRRIYMIGQKQFEHIRRICRYECCFLNLMKRDYELAIYQAYSLLQNEPNSYFLKKSIAYGLYGISKYANAGKLWDIHTAYDEQTGGLQQLAFLIEKLKPEELNVLAIHHHQKLLQLYEDEELQLQYEDLLAEFVNYYAANYSLESLGKNKSHSPNTSEEGNVDFVMAVFESLMKDSNFRGQYERVLSISLDEGEVQASQDEKKENHSEKEMLKKFRKAKSFNLGLDRVIFVEPFYERINDQTGKTEYLSQEQQKKQYINLLEKYANKLSLSHTVLSTERLQAKEVEVFNDLSILDEWITEKSQHGDLSMISLNHSEVQYLGKKYNCQHFVWTGSISLTHARSGRLLVVSAGFLLPVLLPYSIYYAATPAHQTWYYTVIYNIETGNFVLQYPRLVRMKDKPDIMNATIYDLIFQMKNNP